MKFFLVIIGGVIFISFCLGSKVYAFRDDVIESDEELTFETLRLKGIEEGRLIEAVGDILGSSPEELEQEREERIPQEGIYKVGILNKIEHYFLRHLEPYTEVEGTVNDNIYLTHEDEKKDFITTITYGGRYEIGGAQRNAQRKKKRRTYILLDGGLKTKYYSYSKRANRYNPYAKVTFSQRFNRISFNGIYTFTHDQITRSSLEKTLSTKGDLINYYKSYYSAGSVINLNRIVIEPMYSFIKLVYKKDDFKVLRSYTDHTAYIKINLRVFPKTYIFVDYDHSIHDIYKRHEKLRSAYIKDDFTGNYTQSNYWVGAEGRMFRKLNGIAKLGYRKKDFEGGPNFEYYTLDVKLYYHPTGNLKFDLGFKRQNEECSRIGEVLKDDTVFLFGCEYTPPALKALSLDLEFSYTDYAYHSYRRDRLYRGIFNAEYEITDWMKVVAEYTYDKRSSDEEPYDEYQNNITSVKCVFEF